MKQTNRDGERADLTAVCVWTNQSTLSDPACLFQFKGNSGNFFTDGCFLQLAINKQSTDELSLRVLRRKEVYSNRRAQWCQVERGWYEVKGWAVPRTMQSKWWQGSARWIFISVEKWTLIVVDGDRWSKIIGQTLREFYLAILLQWRAFLMTGLITSGSAVALNLNE